MRQVSADNYIHPLKLFFDKSLQVGFHYVGIDDFNIIKVSESLIEYGEKSRVKLNADHLFGDFCKLSCQYADTCTDFDYTCVFIGKRVFSHTGTY